jgi:hypothetical protein
MTSTKQHPIILGAREQERNPLRKLMAGFCDPFIPKNDEEETIESHEESPKNNVKGRELAIETAETNTTTGFSSTTKARHGSSVRFEKLDTDGSLHIPSQSATRNMSETSIESNGSMTVPLHDESNTPELEIAKSVVRRRRQHALQVFFASLIFVMAAILTLQKLGYSIADFHAPTHSLLSSSSSGRPWIHIFDKTAIESGTFNTKTNTESHKVTRQDKVKADEVNLPEKNEEDSSGDFEDVHRNLNIEDSLEIRPSKSEDPPSSNGSTDPEIVDGPSHASESQEL